MRGWIRALAVLALALTALVPPAWAAGLSNGVEVLSGPDCSVAYLSSTPPDRDTVRSLPKLKAEVEQVLNRARRAGVALDRPLRIVVVEDREVPSRDLWTACGVEPDEATVARLRADVEAGFGFDDLDAFFAHRDAATVAWPMLGGLPGPMVFEQADLALAHGDELQQRMAQLRTDDIVEALDQPLAEMRTSYFDGGEASYCPERALVWVERPRGQRLHRFYDLVTHEVGHHVFAAMVRRAAEKAEPGRIWRQRALSGVTIELTALAELFADWSAVAAGNNLIIQLQGRGNLPDEAKRHFGKRRTLEQFMADQAAAGADGYLFDAAHNVLNPARTFLWELRQALDGKRADWLMIELTRGWLDEFFGFDIHKYGHRPDAIREPGLFRLDGYLTGVVSENARFLLHAREAATLVLCAKDRAVVEDLVVRVFGRLASRDMGAGQ